MRSMLKHKGIFLSLEKWLLRKPTKPIYDIFIPCFCVCCRLSFFDQLLDCAMKPSMQIHLSFRCILNKRWQT